MVTHWLPPSLFSSGSHCQANCKTLEGPPERTVTLKKSPCVVLTENMVCFFKRSTSMTEVRWERYPSVAQLPYARSWLQIQGNLGLAPNTIDAYGRALS